jgi:SAM-dependent methyltransferase
MTPPALEQEIKTRVSSAGGLRLNLGGRGTQINGFKTVDLSTEHDVDYRCDVSKLPMADGTVDEIYASQILEHFPHTRTLEVLKEWNRVLKTGGLITIGVPDFHRAVEIYKTHGLIQYVVNSLYGDQGYDLAFHYAPFTFARLSFLMDKSGFRDIKRIGAMPYGIRDCSALLFTEDKKPVSLNVQATK